MTKTENAIFSIFLITVVLATVIWTLSRLIIWVPPHHVRTVMRRKAWFGPPWVPDRFHRTLGAGLHMIIKGLDEASAPIDLREQMVRLPEQRAITADNEAACIDALLSFQVINLRPEERIGDIKAAVVELASRRLLKLIGNSDLQQAQASRDELAAQLRETLDAVADKWGIRVGLVEIRSFIPEPMGTGTGQAGLFPPWSWRAT